MRASARSLIARQAWLAHPHQEMHILTDLRESSGPYRDGLLITSDRRTTSVLLAHPVDDFPAGQPVQSVSFCHTARVAASADVGRAVVSDRAA
uniref:Uncharacterized protein n=1 Tax=Mycobacterium riyadhense TaxID=486698 RepID=A0A653F448_9MYCO|nr:hypothetical protein BIN_B_05532 [Mycobacterium riyadhense]